MSQMKDNLLAAVKERFAAVAASPGQEKKFPVDPASAKKLGYDLLHDDVTPNEVARLGEWSD